MNSILRIKYYRILLIYRIFMMILSDVIQYKSRDRIFMMILSDVIQCKSRDRIFMMIL